MFDVQLRGGLSRFDVRFRPVLVDTLAVRQTGLIENAYDRCMFRLDDVIAYEDENGNMVPVNA